MYQEKVSIEVPASSSDLLAHIVLSRVNDMLLWRHREQVGGKSLSTVMTECHNQRNGILSCEDQEIANEVGVNAYINLTGLKASALDAWLMNILGEATELPFTVEPTPVPELSADGVEEALGRVKEQLYGQQFMGDTLQLIRDIKNKVWEAEKETADESAQRMFKLMTDQMIEGKFPTALSLMIRNFSTYPFAAMHGPVVTSASRLSWSGNTLRAKDETFYSFRNLSPFDLFWTPDSPDTQQGTGIAIIERWSRQTLLQCAKLKSYNQSAIEKVLTECDEDKLGLMWVSGNPDRQSDEQLRTNWRHSGATVEVVKHYGYLSGRELAAANVPNVESGQYYNTTVTMIGRHVIQVFIDPNPNAFSRPVFTASFERVGDTIAGVSIAQKLRDVERCYMTVLRYMVRNAAQASEPITEADYARIIKHMSPDDLGKLIPGVMYLADRGMAGDNRPALQFHNVPAQTGNYMSAMQMFMDLSDRITQIPASIHGEPVGTGANRTFRGMSMLYGNALKPIQLAISNLDDGIFGPSAELLYNYNMMYNKDTTIKGDALIRARGATSLLEKETRKQTAMEVLQLVAQVGASAAEQMPPGLMQWAFNEVLKLSDVPKELLFGAQQAMQQGGMPQQGMPPQGMPPQGAPAGMPQQGAPEPMGEIA